MGILKIDVLGLDMLTCIRKAFSLIHNSYPPEKRPTPEELTLATVPAEDPAVYDMICAADTIGVFQIESDWALTFYSSRYTQDRNTKALEAIVYWELCRRGANVRYELIGPKGQEVDFIATFDNKDTPTAIQVCYSLQDAATTERELSVFEALAESDHYRTGTDRKLITMDTTVDSQTLRKFTELDVEVEEAWRWLL